MKESADDYRKKITDLMNKIEDINILKRTYKLLVYLYLKIE